MAGSLPFKCYLTNNSQEKEIRRFALESDVVGSFTYLKEKVRAAYPQLLRENFNLYYIDDEGDKVIISSDDELVSALMFVKRKDDEPFRLIIQMTGAIKTEHTSPTGTATGNCQGEIHRGVTCDGCQGPVRGFRYKCFQCPDYDLCGKCETSGVHSGHSFLRISGPLPASFQSMRSLLGGGPEMPGWRRKHHHHGQHHQHGRHHHGHHGGWNAWCPSGMNVDPGHSSSGAGATQGCKREASGNSEGKQCPYKFYMDQAKETATSFQANHPEYLAGLGSTITSLFEGLGFSSMEKSCPRSTPQKAENKNEECAKPEAKSEDVAKQEHKLEAEQPKEEVAKERIIPITLEKEEINQPPVVNPATLNPYAAVSDAIAAARAAELATAQIVADFANQAGTQVETPRPVEVSSTTQTTEITETKPSPALQATVSTSPKSSSPTRDSDGWTMVDDVEKVNISPSFVYALLDGKDSASAPGAQLGARPKSPPQQQTEPLVENAPIHPDPLIAGALETMLAMGFTNEGGWLAKLLEVKGGDIGKALDVLHSQFQQT